MQFERDFVIAGVLNQAGLKEDRLAQSILPQHQVGFDDVLSTTGRPGNSAPSLTGTIGKTGPDPRLRDNFLLDPDQEDLVHREDHAATDRETQQLLNKASPSAHPVQTAPEPAPPPPTGKAAQSDMPSKALQRRDGEEQSQGREGVQPSHIGRPGLVAQAGMAAYRLSAHGQEESLLAETAGAIPLGDKLLEADESVGKGADRLDKSALFAKPPAEQADATKADKPLNALDILNLSRKATAQTPQLDELMPGDVELETAHTRTELLTRLGQPIPSRGQAEAAAAAALLQGNGRGTGQGAGGQENRSTANSVLKPAAERPPIAGLNPPLDGSQAARMLAKTPAEVRGRQIMNRVAQQAKWMIRNNRQEVTFKLQPENLGEVKLKVTQTDGYLRVEMTVDNPAVKRMVESQMDDLHRLLQEEQLASGNFEFNVDVRQGGDSRDSESFTLTPPATAPGGADGNPEAPKQYSHVDRLQPVWGESGSGVYA
ncbi:MAG: flagellar hook-length control protein FliK [SAR324 cluster bacterium]|nr:flagellar hook-length control protein FliK [SAR324 cluster bacterium]